MGDEVYLSFKTNQKKQRISNITGENLKTINKKIDKNDIYTSTSDFVLYENQKNQQN